MCFNVIFPRNQMFKAVRHLKFPAIALVCTSAFLLTREIPRLHTEEMKVGNKVKPFNPPSRKEMLDRLKSILPSGKPSDSPVVFDLLIIGGGVLDRV